MKQRDEKKETRKLPMGRRGKRLMVIYAALVLMMLFGRGAEQKKRQRLSGRRTESLPPLLFRPVQKRLTSRKNK